MDRSPAPGQPFARLSTRDPADLNDLVAPLASGSWIRPEDAFLDEQLHQVVLPFLCIAELQGPSVAGEPFGREVEAGTYPDGYRWTRYQVPLLKAVLVVGHAQSLVRRKPFGLGVMPARARRRHGHWVVRLGDLAIEASELEVVGEVFPEVRGEVTVVEVGNENGKWAGSSFRDYTKLG